MTPTSIALPARDEIRRRLRQRLPELAQRYGVVKLHLFGSYGRGEQRPGSDVDHEVGAKRHLLVEIDNPQLTLLQFVELRDFLSDLLGVPVDLVEKETLKPVLGEQILREAEPV
jgi:predicted nucleotidyltransferase